MKQYKLSYSYWIPVILLLCVHFVLSSSPLPSSASHTILNSNILKEKEYLEVAQSSSSTRQKDNIPRRQTDANNTVEPVFEWNKTADGLYLPLTATVYYDYVEAFLLGLDLDSYYQKASDCTNALIFTVDDCFYFANNITLMTNWSDPLLNISKLIGANLSSSVLYCFQFGYNVYTKTITDAQSYSTFTDWLLAFIFNQAGNTLSYKAIFDDINADRQNNYLTDIAYQVGRLIRKIFDFSPLTTGSLSSAKVTQSLTHVLTQAMQNITSNKGKGESQYELDYLALAQSFASTFESTKDIENYERAKKEIKKQKQQSILKLEDFEERIQDRIDEKIKLEATSYSSLSTPTTWLDIYGLYIVDGIFQGFAGVFPKTTLIGDCRLNITQMVTSATTMSTQFSTASSAGLSSQQTAYTTAVTSLTTLMKSVHGSVFNCYYGTLFLIDPAQYEDLFTVDGMLLNFVFNMGDMYSSIMYIINMSVAPNSINAGLYYYNMGYCIADFITRLFFRTTDITSSAITSSALTTLSVTSTR